MRDRYLCLGSLPVSVVDAKPPTVRCPICGKDDVNQYRPFCSRRCADVDLGRWMTGHYSIPSEEDADPGSPDTLGADSLGPDGRG